jgi:2-haloacid dehalogenase
MWKEGLMATTLTRALVFDAYGTLFDVRAVADACAGVAADPAGFVALWRAKQLEYAFLRSLMRRYEDFWLVTRAALRYAAATTRTPLTAQEEEALMESWFYVAPFPDVVAALHALVERNLPLAILSNGAPSMLARLVAATGLDGYFRALLSVDAVRVYKPDPAVYVLAERALGLARAELLFVSSNSWDVAGAREFGLRVCWVNRGGAQPDELGVRADYVLASLAELPELIVG